MSFRNDYSTNYVEWKPDKSVINFFEKLRRKRDLQANMGVSQNDNTITIPNVSSRENSVGHTPSKEQHIKKDTGIESRVYENESSTVDSKISRKRSTTRRKAANLEKKIAEAWL
jgi:hypothetical protein